MRSTAINNFLAIACMRTWYTFAMASTVAAKNLGKWGENFIAERLVSEGAVILARNYRSGHQEIDLIALQDEVIHFVEVKTRRSNKFAYGEDAMHPHKIAGQYEAILNFLDQTDNAEADWQLDLYVVEVRNGAEPEIILFEGIGLDNDR